MEIAEIQGDLERFENLIKMINFEYNQYFAGNKKNPPIMYEREINKIIHKYNLNQIKNSTLRFKFNNLVARYLTFKDRWNKRMMEHEGAKKSPAKFFTGKEIQDDKRNIINYEKELSKLPDKYDKNKIKNLIEEKIIDLQSKGFENFKVEIEVVDNKPKLRIKHNE
jgi:hypothetical protein